MVDLLWNHEASDLGKAHPWKEASSNLTRFPAAGIALPGSEGPGVGVAAWASERIKMFHSL